MSAFDLTYKDLARQLLEADNVDVGEWHAQDVSGVPQLVTREIRNVLVYYKVPHFMTTLIEDVTPNEPFAEAQFQDRVSGEPLNPPPSANLWPYNNEAHKHHLDENLKFSHTYPERFWPKHAGERGDGIDGLENNYGIRYDLGDLNDVVEMLGKSPFTRQAYLPVWFPEDTGNRGIRLPCSLGYHFLLRDGKLHMTYFIRSVDFVRHFRDDFYMAARLLQWVLAQLVEHWVPNYEWGQVAPGTLTMHMISLHCMGGDLPMMRRNLATK